jgi:hypothetical protein
VAVVVAVVAGFLIYQIPLCGSYLFKRVVVHCRKALRRATIHSRLAQADS